VITALALLGYAVCVALYVPVLLTPLTRRGVSVRVGLAAWLTAMASVLLSAAVAICFSFRTVAADWPQLTQALCRSVAGGACTPAVYRSALYEGGVTALAVATTLLAAVALWRYGRRVQRSRVRTRSHAQAALLVGRAITDAAGAASAPGTGAAGSAAGSAAPAGIAGGPRAVMLDDPRPAAYCVAGRPAAIVVTSGALAVLDPPQLRAVLAHENAHLAHRHHTLATITRGLAAAFPGVPLFTRGAAEVARLTEMSADDTAVRTSGRHTLVTALIAIATGAAFSSAGAADTAVPRAAMAAASCAVPDRVERLLRPSGSARSAAFTGTLTLILTLLAAAPPALTLLLTR
jgi:beta-lactamase regulating signal transducer with metallopeptidase domain